VPSGSPGHRSEGKAGQIVADNAALWPDRVRLTAVSQNPPASWRHRPADPWSGQRILRRRDRRSATVTVVNFDGREPDAEPSPAT
jgi:hypothetical protein